MLKLLCVRMCLIVLFVLKLLCVRMCLIALFVLKMLCVRMWLKDLNALFCVQGAKVLCLGADRANKNAIRISRSKCFGVDKHKISTSANGKMRGFIFCPSNSNAKHFVC